MKRFVVIYHAPVNFVAGMENTTDEQKSKEMDAWMAWSEKCGTKLVEMGAPLFGGQKIKPNGTSEGSERQVCGYSLLQAESIDEAKSLLKDHPHLAWREGCEIEVHESMPMG